MQPKKERKFMPAVYGIALVIFLFLALHAAISFESVDLMVQSGKLKESQALWYALFMMLERSETTPFDIYFNQYTLKSLLYGGGIWLVFVALIESSRKNYIRGKEFGESRWGTIADIKDLFAVNIEKEEIRKAKQIGNPIGRIKVRRDTYKRCEEDGRFLLEVKLKELKEAEEKDAEKITLEDKKEIKEYIATQKNYYKEKREEIKRQLKEDVEIAKKQAWKPDQLKIDFKERLKEIEEDDNLFPKEEDKQKAKAFAKKEYEKGLKAFYSYSGRVAKIKLKYKDADMLFTKTERISIFNWKLNNNTLILGGSGAGKTRGYVMPNILQAHSSFVVTDPKGEILEKSGYFLEKVKGYKIRVLNLHEMSESDYYNPFVYIHPERDGYEERVLTLIETIIANTTDENKGGGSDPFWDNAERLFLQAIFFFTVDGFPPEERNINTALKLIAMLELEEENDNKDSDLDLYVEFFAERFGEDHIGVQQYNEFRSKASGKTAKSIVITASARFAPFRTSNVGKLMNSDTMCLDRIGEEKMAIFVVVPPTNQTFNFIAGMLFTQLFQEIEHCATQVHKYEGQRLPTPVRFILDEYANTCKIPRIVNFLAYARSFGVGITMILQSLEQLKKMHEKEWGVVIDNCNTLLYLGSISHMDTLEYMSKLVGKGTFDKRTSGRTRGGQGSTSTNEDVIGRELMMPDDIRRLPKEKCLFVVGGRPAFYSDKYLYESHPNYRFTRDANSKYSFHYIPQHEKEEQVKTAHREEVAEPVPSENASVAITAITMETDPMKQLAKVSKNIGEYEIISDEEIWVDDGENMDAESFLQSLMGEDAAAKKQAKLTVSQETEVYIQKLHEDRIRIEEDMLKQVNRLGRLVRSESLAVISDEEMQVDDGESTSSVDEKIAEYVMNEDIGSSEEIADVLDDMDIEILSLEGFDKDPDLE